MDSFLYCFETPTKLQSHVKQEVHHAPKRVGPFYLVVLPGTERSLPRGVPERTFFEGEKKLLKKILALVVLGIFCILTPGLTASAQTAKQLQATEKARASVLKLGVGRTSRVEIKLNDETKVKGYISDAGQDRFTVTDLQNGSSQTLLYSDVADVKKPGGGISSRTWIILGGAAAAAVVVGIIVKPAFCDGGAQTRFPC